VDFPIIPQRGFVPGVIATLNRTAPSGSPKYQVGYIGSSAAFVAERSAPASGSIETIIPVAGSAVTGNQAMFVTVTAAGSAGSQLVSIRGLPHI
jgi:hypothetical protein